MASCSAAIILAVTLMALGLWSDQAFARNMLSESFAATVVFFGSAYWFKPDDPRHAELLLLEKDLQTPAYRDSAQLKPVGLGAYVLIGKICVIMGLIMIACVFAPSTAVAASSLNVVAGVLSLLLGIAILYLTRNQSPSKKEAGK